MHSEYVEQRDGGYYVAGTRISLDSVVYAFNRGDSPERILERYPLLSVRIESCALRPPPASSHRNGRATVLIGFQADADFDHDIVLAVRQGRILISHNLRTMPGHFRDRTAAELMFAKIVCAKLHRWHVNFAQE